MMIAAATRYGYDFAAGSRDMRALLGGNGADLAEMTRVLGADLVPAGFTISTEACVAACGELRRRSRGQPRRSAGFPGRP